MKFTKGITTVIICLLTTSMFAQVTINDVTLPAKTTVNGADLILNGAGLRKKLFFKLYVGGLYLTRTMSEPAKVIEENEAMSIHLEITSKLISSDNMSEAVVEGFEKSTNGNSAKFAKEIKTFMDAFSEEIVIGNKFDFTYIPGTGVIVSKNGKVLTTIKGYEFKKALFGIWLGSEPADDDLKDGMMGK